MDDRKDTQVERPEEEGGHRERKPSKLRQFFKRFLGLIVTLVVVLGLIFTAMLQDSNYLDRIRRWLLYGESTSQNMYAFAADGTNRYGQIDDLLVVVSQNYIQFLRDDGTAYYTHQVQLNQPALDIGGGLADAISLPLKLIVLLNDSGLERNFIIDEPGKHLSINHVPKFAHFLKTISQKLGVQIIMLSHHTCMDLFADSINEVSLEGSKSHIERIK